MARRALLALATLAALSAPVAGIRPAFAQNTPPHFTQITDMTVSAEVRATQEIHAVDPDGDYLSFSKVSGPAYMNVETGNSFPLNALGTVTVQPGPGDVGVATGVVGVAGGGVTTTASITITVIRSCPSMLAARVPIPWEARTTLMGDVDGDGTPDLVAFALYSNTVGIWLGNGDGTFRARGTVAVQYSEMQAVLADVNGDSRADLIWTTFSPLVYVQLADATGMFGAPLSPPIQLGILMYSEPVAAADLNGDGRADLAIGNSAFPWSIETFLGNGDGTFAHAASIPVPAQGSLTTADFNGDGRQDVAAGEYYGQDALVLFGDGAGGLGSPATYPVLGYSTHSVAAGDLNGDGRPDLAVARDNLVVLLNDGAGHFGAAHQADTPYRLWSAHIGDVTGDGKTDVLAIGSEWFDQSRGAALVFPGNGGGQLGPPSGTIVEKQITSATAIGDLNHDGRLDWVTTDALGRSLEFLNLGCGGGADQPPVVLAPARVDVAEGAALTLTVYAADPDAEPITSLSVAPLPSGAVFTPAPDAKSGTLAWTPGYDQAGTHAIAFQASNALTGSKATSIVVVNTDRAPVVTAPASKIACAGSTIAFTVTAADPDGDALASLIADPLPPGATFAANASRTAGEFHWITTAGNVGSHTITFRAADVLTGSASTLIVVESALSCPISFDVETADTTGSIYTSALALDASGQPHVAYWSSTGLRYAHKSGAQWIVESIPQPTFASYGVDLALDAAGEPWIAFSFQEPLGPASYQDVAKVARRSGGVWTIENLEGGVNSDIAIAFDSAGVLHAAYYRFFGAFAVRYATRGASGWSAENASPNLEGANEFSLAFDPQGRPHIGYSFRAILHAVRTPTGWVTDSQPSAAGVSMDLDSQGQPHLASFLPFPPAVRYHSLVNGAWQVETVDGVAPDVGERVTLKIDRYGRPILAYHDLALGRLKVAWKDGGTWRIQLVDAGGVGKYPSLALAGNANPAIAYLDDSYSELRYAVGTVPPPNRPPSANAGGPYAGGAGEAIRFDGSGSSDPDGDALTYAWDYGDGIQGSGVMPEHAYAAAGSYEVTLTVSDGALTDESRTTAAIMQSLQARAFLMGGSRSVPLQHSGRPTLCVQIEPVGGSYRNEDLDPSSVIMRSDSTGVLDQIRAIAGKSDRSADRDHNGVDELQLCFAREDLARLFSETHGRTTVTARIEGTLRDGGLITATLELDVVSTGQDLVSLVYPNPLNPVGILGVGIPLPGPLRVSLYDVHGRIVRRLVDEPWVGAGFREIPIDAGTGKEPPLASGIYFYRIESSGRSITGRLTVAK